MKNNKFVTDKQYLVNRNAMRDTARTDRWLKENGLNVEAVSSVCGEVLVAQQKAHELLKNHANLLTTDQLLLLENFKHRLSDKKKRKKLKPSSAYPILNLCRKIQRQVHRDQMQTRQKIQALRNQ